MSRQSRIPVIGAFPGSRRQADAENQYPLAVRPFGRTTTLSLQLVGGAGAQVKRTPATAAIEAEMEIAAVMATRGEGLLLTSVVAAKRG